MQIVALCNWTAGNSISKLAFYYDYQLSKARRTFSEEVFPVKLRCCPPWATLLSRFQYRRLWYNFEHFVANDVKGGEVATSNIMEPAAHHPKLS